VREAASEEGKLVVFPEAFVSGYPRGFGFGSTTTLTQLPYFALPYVYREGRNVFGMNSKSLASFTASSIWNCSASSGTGF